MRTIDEEKKEKIVNAVLDIVKEEGFTGLSFGKIASRAKVSTATAYVYFENKEDMISKIYIDVKMLMDDGLKQSIDKGTNIRERLFNCVFHFVKKFCDNPREANFMFDVLANPEVLTEEAVKTGEFYTKPMFDLYEEAMSQRLLKTQSTAETNAFLFAPVTWLMGEYEKQNHSFTAEDLKPVIWVSVDGILNNR